MKENINISTFNSQTIALELAVYSNLQGTVIRDTGGRKGSAAPEGPAGGSSGPAWRAAPPGPPREAVVAPAAAPRLAPTPSYPPTAAPL